MSKHARSLVLIGSFALGACASNPPEDAHIGITPVSHGAPSSANEDANGVSDAAPRDANDGAATASDAPLEGANLIAEARAVFRVAACGEDDAAAIPPKIDRAMVDAHCAALKAMYAEYTHEWLAVAMPFLENLRPKSPSTLPSTVVYPFGGGDLMGALATFPDFAELTTISLETAGDVRGIMKADSFTLTRELATLREHLARLFLKAHSRTVNMDIDSRGAIPGELAFTMAALAIHGYEPVAFRYFEIQKGGTLHFLDEAEIAKSSRITGFSNAETRFRKRDDHGGGPVKILRHVAFDLSDAHLKKDPSLVLYLDHEAQLQAGRVTEMTKAASHLLWNDANFSVIRDWLATHTDFMISDTTGFPPRIAKQYGFVQDVYGVYDGPEPFGPVNNRDATDFKKLFKGSAPIAFRYGYPDNHSHGHIVVTRRP